MRTRNPRPLYASSLLVPQQVKLVNYFWKIHCTSLYLQKSCLAPSRADPSHESPTLADPGSHPGDAAPAAPAPASAAAPIGPASAACATGRGVAAAASRRFTFRGPSAAHE